MSRSFRRSPCVPITTRNSEKRWKRFYNRALRKMLKVAIDFLPKRHEAANQYGPKDGKRWLGDQARADLLK